MVDDELLHLYFTGAGVPTSPNGYQQRLFEAHAPLSDKDLPSNWSRPQLLIDGISADYMAADAHSGEPGKIKAFRDPAYFRDPADGAEYLTFTASLAGSASDYNGAVGLAGRDAGGWKLLSPLIHADGVNNELERAHLVFHKGRYYVFWVTQRQTFAPGLHHAPTGLYGMVADTLYGEYRPLNRSGLVLANPDEEPFQTYSWFVSAGLQVSSFVDLWALSGKTAPTAASDAAHHFGGVPAPLLQLVVDGDHCTLAQIQP